MRLIDSKSPSSLSYSIMFSLSFLAAIALVPFAVAQDATLGIQAIEAHFQQSHIVPDLFQSFTPEALLSLNFAGNTHQIALQFALD